MQRQSHRQNRANGQEGETLNTGSLPRRIFGKQKKAVLASYLSNTTNPTAYIHRLQDQPHPRTLHLEAQLGPLATSTTAGRKED